LTHPNIPQESKNGNEAQSNAKEQTLDSVCSYEKPRLTQIKNASLATLRAQIKLLLRAREAGV